MSNTINPNKDQSGLLMMATYKNVMPYSTLRSLVDKLLTLNPIQPYYQVRESVITEIIYLQTENNLESINQIINKWNEKIHEKVN